MAPTSYQGRMEVDGKGAQTRSQTTDWAKSGNAPGMAVSDIIGDKGNAVYSVTPQTPIKEAVSILTEKKIGALVVVGPENQAIGIISERDVINNLHANGATVLESPVQTAMTPDPVTCTLDYRVEEVMKIMTARRFRHMPVVKEGSLVGVISVGDVVKQRMQEIEYENLKIKQAVVG